MYQLRQNVDIGICMQVFMILFQLILNYLTYSSARFVPHSNRHIDDNMPGTDVTMPNCSICLSLWYYKKIKSQKSLMNIGKLICVYFIVLKYKTVILYYFVKLYYNKAVLTSKPALLIFFSQLNWTLKLINDRFLILF